LTEEARKSKGFASLFFWLVFRFSAHARGWSARGQLRRAFSSAPVQKWTAALEHFHFLARLVEYERWPGGILRLDGNRR
jgi:hypothetical protein